VFRCHLFRGTGIVRGVQGGFSSSSSSSFANDQINTRAYLKGFLKSLHTRVVFPRLFPHSGFLSLKDDPEGRDKYDYQATSYEYSDVLIRNRCDVSREQPSRT
jgi:hypothetical protein